MAIQECYYFKWIWVHWGSVQTYLFIFSDDYYFCYSLFFEYILLKKDTKIKKRWNILKKKNEFIKKRWGGPTFKLWKGSWGPTFKFWRGSWVPTFKLWRGCRVPGPGVLVPILHHAFLERVLRVDVKLRLLKLINGGGGY